MARRRPLADQILEAIIRSPGCDLEEVVIGCPDFTWNHVFLELDRLSRSGGVRVTCTSPGVYRLDAGQSLKHTGSTSPTIN